jgi:hypothetical protein
MGAPTVGARGDCTCWKRRDSRDLDTWLRDRGGMFVYGSCYGWGRYNDHSHRWKGESKGVNAFSDHGGECDERAGDVCMCGHCVHKCEIALSKRSD